MTRTTVRFRRIDPRATLPEYKSELAAGLDVSACLPDGTPITLDPIWKGGSIVKVPTGLAMALEPGFEAQVRPRSGLASKHALTLPNSPGTIDADYRGEVLIPLINLGSEPVQITHAMRIAQMIIAPVSHASIIEVDELEATERGHAGFGSTGH